MLYQFSVKNQWNPNWLWKKSRGGWIHIVVPYLALVICYIAMENGWFIDGLPIKAEVFQSCMLVYQRAPHLNSTRSVPSRIQKKQLLIINSPQLSIFMVVPSTRLRPQPIGFAHVEQLEFCARPGDVQKSGFHGLWSGYLSLFLDT